MSNTSVNAVGASGLIALLSMAAEADLAAFIQSQPGVGKSNIVRDLAKAWGLNFVDIRLATRSPVDVGGYPTLSNQDGREVMKFIQTGELPITPGNIIFLDEFSCATRATQSAALQLVLERRIGEYVVPENTFIVLAGNRKIDKVHVEELSSALVNRVMMIEMKPSISDWTVWANNHGLNDQMIAFLEHRPELLNDFDGAKWDKASAFATPRSWEAADRVTNTDSYKSASEMYQANALAGVIGAPASSEYRGFLKLSMALPSVKDALRDPQGTEVPSEQSSMVAMAAALKPQTTPDNVDNALAYLKRFPKEYEVFGVRFIFTKRELIATPAWMAWNKENEALLAG